MMRERMRNTAAQQPTDTGDETGRVVPFRPRSAPPPGGHGPGSSSPLLPSTQSPVQGIAKYEQTGGEDDYRHRMFMNVLGLVASVVLVVAGVWLANTIAELRKNQDCVLSGGRNCAHLDVPSATRR